MFRRLVDAQGQRLVAIVGHSCIGYGLDRTEHDLPTGIEHAAMYFN